MVKSGEFSKKFNSSGQSHEINYPRNPRKVLERKGLHRILIEAHDKSVKPLIEIQKSAKPLIEIYDKLEASWKKSLMIVKRQIQFFMNYI